MLKAALRKIALKPENLDDLIEQLNELTVDVDKERTKMRVFCE